MYVQNLREGEPTTSQLPVQRTSAPPAPPWSFGGGSVLRSQIHRAHGARRPRAWCRVHTTFQFISCCGVSATACSCVRACVRARVCATSMTEPCGQRIHCFDKAFTLQSNAVPCPLCLRVSPVPLCLQLKDVRGITRAEVRTIFRNMPKEVRLEASAIVSAASKKKQATL